MRMSMRNLCRARLWCIALTSLFALAGCKPTATSPHQPASTKSESGKYKPVAETNASASDSSSTPSVETGQALGIGALIDAGKFDQAQAELKLRLVEKPDDSKSIF